MKNNTYKNITIASRGRFVFFDQARELNKNKILYKYITDYPKRYPLKFDIPDDKIRSLLLSAYINHGYVKFRKYFTTNLQVSLDQWTHNRYSKLLPRYIPKQTDFFIGQSSFCLEALLFCANHNIFSAVDHGSLHQREERRFIEEEANKWGINVPKDVAADWLIEKEDQEFQLANNIFVLSTVAKDTLVKNNIHSNKIFINPPGVDLSIFKRSQKNDSKFRVIQVGGISLRKGVLNTLYAFQMADLNNSELLFVGGGKEGSGIEKQISKFTSNKIFFLSPVPQYELNHLYNQSSVFVLSSVADGFAMVVLQAMACGLPVIITENVGAKDIIIDGVNGFVIPVGSPVALKDKLKLLYDNPDLLKEMGIAALETVTNNKNTWKDYGERLTRHIYNLSNS